MRLFMSKASPFVRKVMMTAHETGMIDDLELVPASGNALDPGTMPVDYNPLGKIPALVTDAGETLFDSRVICRYLDAKAGTGLYPEGDDVWPMLAFEALCTGALDAAVLMVYEKRIRPENLRLEPWVEGQWAKVSRAIDMAEAKHMDMLNAPLNMAQIDMSVLLGYLDFRFPDRDWRKDRPNLAVWLEGIARRDSYVATIPEG